jgi:thiol:disulfide interchange protein DsbD
MKIKNQLLSTILLLSYLLFSSCSDKKPDANDKEKNPFGITSKPESQILQPCHWTFTVEQSVNGEVMLISKAKLDSGWHLYSQHISDKGPRTEFAYDSSYTYKLLGNTEEGQPHKEYNPYFEMEVLYFEKEAEFKQKTKVLSKTDFTITGSIDYMVCLDQSQCVHSDEEFSFNVKGNPSEIN